MTRILTSAFLDDPVWGPSFPDRATRPQVASAYWRFMVGEALRFAESRVLVGDAEGDRQQAGSGAASTPSAVSVWYPPGEDELSLEAHPAYEVLVDKLLGTEAASALEQAGAQLPRQGRRSLTLT